MLLMRVRDRPCSAFERRSSSGRLTSRTPSSPFSTVIGWATTCDRVPFGPLTVTSWPAIWTSTPPGTRTGSLPIRDMFFSPSRLPDVGEDFPTHALLVGLTVGQQTLARRDDRDAQATEHAGQTRVLGVSPEAGLADAAHAGVRALASAAVLQGDGQRLADGGGAVRSDVVLHVEGGDVALLLEDLRDASLDLAVRHRDRVVVRLVGVTQTREHVCDRVSHRHDVFFLEVVSLRRGASDLLRVEGDRACRGHQLDLVTPGSSPRWAISRRQIRHRPNLRNTAFGRPQRWQRVYPRTANLGVRAALL